MHGKVGVPEDVMGCGSHWSRKSIFHYRFDNYPGSTVGSGPRELRDWTVWITGHGGEDILSRPATRRDNRRIARKVLGAILGADVAGDLVPQL
jgi:hypothetical protein